MCLGIPMEILSVEGYHARCIAAGVEREVSLLLLQDETLVAGDFVMVQSAHAVRKMTREDARATWDLFDEMLAAADGCRGA